MNNHRGHFLAGRQPTRRRLISIAGVLLWSVILMIGSVQAAPLGTAFTYQGQLQKNDSPFTGTCNFQFSLWDAVSGGSQIESTLTQTGVTVSNGLFTVTLDFGTGVFTGDARWLQIAVQCSGDSGYTTLSPRQALIAAPYALGLWPGAQVIGSVIDASLLVQNTAAGGFGYGVFVRTDSTSSGAAGVMGYAAANSGTTYGIYGKSNSPNGTGVYGIHQASSGSTPGIHGVTNSTSNDAVAILGEVPFSSLPGAISIAVRGLNEGTGGTGIGVWGSHDGGGWGVYGTSVSGVGVYGHTTATSGTTYGVVGESTSTSGSGVRGVATATSGTTYGVVGKSISSDGYGGYFENTSDGIALYAEGNGNGRNKAALRVNNTNTSQGMAAYFTNNSGFHTAHFYNAQSGNVLYLQGSNTGTGDFITAVNNAETNKLFRVTSTGQAQSDVGFSTPAADFAEMLPAVSGLEPGDVLVIGADGKLASSTQPYQATVVGVYSTRPGFIGGQPVDGNLEGHIPLAVVGIVPVKVSTENGPIQPGDLLVASATPGHAMRAGTNPPQGTVIGKALEGLDDGTGVIRMLVVLQ
ncbi:hypothetical protein [Chloroflexus sp.]|uniref:hypothetical protein n=1 Tax=Chloroflexus sp. TaxID=1904827 RepID=UPI002ADDB285|nr:hypothetical protein [Chloroflexus sp.]